MVRSKSASSIWEAALGEIQLQINKTNFQTWLKDTSGLSYESHRFAVGVPNVFTSAWLEKRLYSLIKRTLVKVTEDPEIEITFVVQPEKNAKPLHSAGVRPVKHGNENHAALVLPQDMEALEQKQANPGTPLFSPEPGRLRLNPNYTFDKFIIGDSNRLAYHAALSASEKPGETYNPIFIHAGDGLGKTHLLQAIAHRANATNRSFVFVTAEKFTNEFIESLKQKRMAEFRLKYRYADILLMDDIDFISGKDHTQEGFYHTVKDLHAENRQIVLTSNSSLETIPHLNSRLRSCLDGGLTVSIKNPDLNTKISIIKSKAQQRGVSLLPEVLDFVASKDCENIKRLEGYLNKIIEVQRIKGSMTVAAARETLEEPGDCKSHKSLSPEDIITRVSMKLNISLDAVTNNKKRSIELNRARQIIIYLLREKCNCTFNEIGSLLGGKDHSSILYGYEKASLLINKEDQFKNDLEELSMELQPV